MRTAMSNETKKTGSSFMEKLSTVIVDKRNLIFLLTIILLVFSAFSRNWVEVESDLTYYLPSDSETKQALDIMDEQFTTYGTAEIMVANITPEQAAALGFKGWHADIPAPFDKGRFSIPHFCPARKRAKTGRPAECRAAQSADKVRGAGGSSPCRGLGQSPKALCRSIFRERCERPKDARNAALSKTRGFSTV